MAFIVSSGPAVADDSRRVYSPTHMSTFILYAFDPDLIAGWNTPMRDYEKKYIPEKYHNLPVLGGWYGEGFIPDREVLLASGLKKAFLLSSDFHNTMRISQVLEGLGMEVVTAPGALTASPECFRSMGRSFNRPARGEALAAYAEKALTGLNGTVGNLPDEKRPTIFFAMQEDGLATVCRNSDRGEVLELAGGFNVHQCPPGTENASLRITFEQLMAYDPDVLLIYSPRLMAAIPGNDKWRQLRAVKEGRVYLAPRGPFSWLERPATYMRLIGVQWLANILHPDLYPLDIVTETKTFMNLFFNLELTDEQVGDMLADR